MIMQQIITLIAGGMAIVFLAWYFFGKKEKKYISGSIIHIKVDAGYSPDMIEVYKDKPVVLKILRTDPSDCLDQLVIPQWHIMRTLPLNKEIEVKFTPDEIGEFPFHCGMNMFHGKIIVKD